MLKQKFDPYHKQISAFAQSWLATGASNYSLWINDESVFSWPSISNAAHNSNLDTQTAPIFIESKQIAELRLTGIKTADLQQRLEAEAELLGDILTRDQDLNSMTSWLVDTRDHLLAIYNLLRSPLNSFEVDATLKSLAREISSLAGAEGCFIFVKLKGLQTISVNYPATMVEIPALKKLIAELISSGKDYLNIAREQHWPSQLKNLLLVPTNVRQADFAVLGIINKLKGDFLQSDLKMTQAVAAYAGAQIENALMFQALISKTKIQTEYELAQRVQNQLLPRQLPGFEGVDIWATSRPASIVGGDFYDFMSSSDDGFTFAVGDVSGKGMPAALLMAMTRTAIRTNSHTSHYPTPEDVVSNSNRELYDDFTEVNMFATVFIGQFEQSSNTLVYANAGHAPVIYCPIDGYAQLLEADGTAMGIMPDSFSKNQSLRLHSGDVLVVGTDGFCEARNARDEMFGYNGLLDLTQSLSDKPAQEIAERLCETIDAFSHGHSQEDDQTLVVLKITGS